MTGRDLIIYILEHKLEDVEINPNEIGFITLQQAAIKYNVGIETIKTWCRTEFVNSYKIGDKTYLEDDMKDPRKEKK